MLLSFFFHDVLEQLKANVPTNFYFERVLRCFVTTVSLVSLCLMRHSWRPRDARKKKVEKVTYIWGGGGKGFCYVNSCHILEKMLLYINVYEFLERRIHAFLPKLSDRCFQLVSVRLQSPCWCSNTKLYKFDHEYSRSSPCDHSRKRPALVTTTFVKPCLNCDLNFVMKTSRKRP